MVARISPASTDVVVEGQEREGQRVFVLRTSHAPDQVLLYSREEAIAEALRFATRQGVRVWFAEPGGSFQLVRDHRRVSR